MYKSLKIKLPVRLYKNLIGKITLVTMVIGGLMLIDYFFDPNIKFNKELRKADIRVKVEGKEVGGFHFDNDTCLDKIMVKEKGLSQKSRNIFFPKDESFKSYDSTLKNTFPKYTTNNLKINPYQLLPEKNPFKKNNLKSDSVQVN